MGASHALAKACQRSVRLNDLFARKCPTRVNA